jgi:hypothetical protein
MEFPIHFGRTPTANGKWGPYQPASRIVLELVRLRESFRLGGCPHAHVSKRSRAVNKLASGDLWYAVVRGLGHLLDLLERDDERECRDGRAAASAGVR